MTEPKRYSLVAFTSDGPGELRECTDGAFVTYSDYESLRTARPAADREEVKEAVLSAIERAAEYWAGTMSGLPTGEDVSEWLTNTLKPELEEWADKAAILSRRATTAGGDTIWKTLAIGCGIILEKLEAHCAVQTGKKGEAHAAEGLELREAMRKLIAMVRSAVSSSGPSVTTPAGEADTGRAAHEDVLDSCRERLSILREQHRQKMNSFGDAAEKAASEGDMSAVSVNSTESERHREAFSALNAAIDIFDTLYNDPQSSELPRWHELATYWKDLAEKAEASTAAAPGAVAEPDDKWSLIYWKQFRTLIKVPTSLKDQMREALHPAPSDGAIREALDLIAARLVDLAGANALYGKDNRLSAPEKIERNNREITWLKDLRSTIKTAALAPQPPATGDKG